MSDFIYMDHAATTYLKPEVLEEMKPYLTDYFGNPSSMYSISRENKKAIDKARQQVASSINAKIEEIYFTGGGSEGDNWAIKGAAMANRAKGRHVITTSIEHHAVLHTCEYLKQNGFDITCLNVDSEGKINLDELEKAFRKDTVLVSIMFANNEIGTIQPIKDVGRLCRQHGVLFHTDAVQAMGAVEIDVEDLNIDLLTMAAHKFYGPKGVGALYIRKGTKIDPYVHGGAQERGRRAGTENVAGIVGIGKAIEMAASNMEKESKRLEALRDELINGLLEIEGSKLNGPWGNDRLPGNVNVSFQGVEGEMLLMMLDGDGICASSGSACQAGSIDPSHVLKAIGLSDEMAKGSLRLTIGARTTKEEVGFVIDKVKEKIQRVRMLNENWNREETR